MLWNHRDLDNENPFIYISLVVATKPPTQVLSFGDVEFLYIVLLRYPNNGESDK